MALFSYIGPETVLPAMSILAAIGGFVLTFFGFLMAPFRKAYLAIVGKTPAKEEEQTPAARS